MASPKFDPDELEQRIAAKLTMSALEGEGSVPAARQVLELLDRIRGRKAAEDHRQRMDEFAEQPVDLARYLGYLGEAVRSVEERLSHALTEDERAAYEEGRRRRQLELRAVELDRAVRGQGKPAPWMRS